MYRTAFVAVLGLFLAAPHAGAQDYTDEQLLELFLKQRAAFQEARANPLGQTRSLRLVTVEDLDPATAPDQAAAAPEPDPHRPLGELAADGAAAPDAPAAEDATTIEVAAETPPREPLIFGQLDPELQVNVRITFEFDSAALSADQRPRLQQMCKVMGATDIELFRIIGHTDGVGSEAYNERLSLLRAQEVQRFLVGECGIEPQRLEAVGLGMRFLYKPDDPRSGENRRVEFQALG